MWPYQVANDKPKGKWLLYLEEEPKIESAGGGECYVKDNDVNPLRLKKHFRKELDTLQPPEPMIRAPFNKSYTFNDNKEIESEINILNRIKRDRSMVIKAESLRDSYGKRTDVVHLVSNPILVCVIFYLIINHFKDCRKNTAKCIKIHCIVYKMKKKSEAYIHIKARLWNSTLISDYPKVDLVNIVSHAKIVIPPVYGIHALTEKHSFVVSNLIMKVNFSKNIKLLILILI